MSAAISFSAVVYHLLTQTARVIHLLRSLIILIQMQQLQSLRTT